MTDTSDLTPRQQRRQMVATTEAGMHTLPSVPPAAGSDDQDQHGLTGEARGQLATVIWRFFHDPQAMVGLVVFVGLAVLDLRQHVDHRHPERPTVAGPSLRDQQHRR
jgi:hypothetical protein